MEIIFASTGVECVAAPSRGVIYLDPTLDYESAVEAIHASLPGVHVDAIRHWVEKAMPSARPLNRRPPALPRSRRHARLRNAALVLALVATSAAGTWGALWWKHRYVDDAFTSNPIFTELARDREWVCDRGFDQPMSASCVTSDAINMRVAALASETSTVYTFTYERLAAPHMNRLVVFKSRGRARAWITLEHVNANDGMHPNLLVGPTWMLYGTDRERILIWADELPRDADQH